jgi:hypothetical protein
VKRTRCKAAALGIAVALALGIGACGSDGDETTTTVQPPPVSATTADRLAKLSNRLATDLEAGETCDAAYAADDLKAAVEDADLSVSLRPGVEEVATRLVNEVNCPPPPPPPEPEPEEKKKDEERKKDEEKKKEGDGHKDQGGDEGKNDPPGHGGVPPGQAKLKGEEG